MAVSYKKYFFFTLRTKILFQELIFIKKKSLSNEKAQSQSLSKNYREKKIKSGE